MLFSNIIDSGCGNPLMDYFQKINLASFVKKFDYQLIKAVNAYVISADHIYFEPLTLSYVPLSSLITGCTSASLTLSGADCTNLKLSMASAGPLISNYPYPNLECSIQVWCSAPPTYAPIFTVSSYSYLCTSFNTKYYTPISMQDCIFILGDTSTLFNQIANVIAAFTLTPVPISTTCQLADLQTNILYPFPYTFPTTALQDPLKYFIYCTTSHTSCQKVYSNSFSISVIPCTPSINSQPSPSYTNNVYSFATPVTIIASGYASTTSPCVLSYELNNLAGLIYTGSDISIDLSTGAVSIISNNLFSAKLMIKVTSTYSTTPNPDYSNTFTVDQVCGPYCTPIFNGIASSYSLNVSNSTQTILQNYATTTNPMNCIMTYSLQNSADNSTYTGTDLRINSTTGIISTTNLNSFTSLSIWITITSTYSALPCSGTLTSSAFFVDVQCSVQCTPTFTVPIQSTYSFQIQSSSQTLIQSYASSPKGCAINYSLQNAVGSSPYTGSDIAISPTTGIIQTQNLNAFTTSSLQIKLTSANSNNQCSGTVESSNFKIQITQSQYCLQAQLVRPLNFQFLKVLSADGPNFIYGNFTTSFVNCKISSHSIVENKNNQIIPTGLNQTQEGHQQFEINVKKQFINIPKLYDFQIKVMTEDGSAFYQAAKIYVDKCDQDQISLNKSQTRFYFNLTAGYKYGINLSDYFQNLYPNACQLTFKTIEANQDSQTKAQPNSEVNKKKQSKRLQAQNWIKTENVGLFVQIGNFFYILPQTEYIFTNQIIKIQASNSKISSNSLQFLIFNISINQPAKSQKYLQNLNLMKNYLQQENQQQGLKYTKSMNAQNKNNLQVLIQSSSMNQNGIIQIAFNQNLTIPDFAIVALNLSQNDQIIQSQYFPQRISTFGSLFDILQLQQIIQFQIICNSNINQKYLNFEIMLVKWDHKEIEIFVNFTYPQIVSLGKNLDKLSIQILNGSNFTSNQSDNEQLDIFKNGYFEVDIPPQRLLSVEKQKQVAQIAQTSFSSIIVIQSVFQMIIQQTIQPSYKLLLNLQMQSGLKYYQVSMPYQAFLYLQIVNQTIEFKVDWSELLQSLGIKINFEQFSNIQFNKLPQLPSNLQRAGINTLSIISNMKSVLIVIGIFLLLNVIAPLFLIFSDSQKGLGKFLKKQYSDLKYNGLIRSTTVGILNQANSITIILMYYRNQNWKDFKISSKNDQIQNICIWSLIMVCLISFPTILFFKIHLNKDQLNKNEFIEQYGVLIEGMKLRKPTTKYVFPLLLLNRLVFAFIPVSFFNVPSLQIIFVILESLLYNAFILQAQVNVDWIDYYQDVFNEYSLLIMYTLLTLFGDTGLIFCLDTNIQIEKKIYAQQIAGIFFTSIGIFVVVLNIGTFFKKQINSIYLHFLKYHNILMLKMRKQKNKEIQNINEHQIQTDLQNLVDLKTKESKSQIQRVNLQKPNQEIISKIESYQKLLSFFNKNSRELKKIKQYNGQNILYQAENKENDINIIEIQNKSQDSINKEFTNSELQQIQDLSKNNDFNKQNVIKPINRFQPAQLKKKSSIQKKDNIYSQFINAYQNHQKFLFKGHKQKYRNQSDQEGTIELMAFRENDTIEQLQDKHKQLNRYLESIRGYNYSNFQELPLYNLNRIKFNNCIANMKDVQIKKIRITLNI